MEEDSLDSLITSKPENLSAQREKFSVGDVPFSPEGMPRPKLRKIKRPKIRPMSDVPPAPEKVMPQSPIVFPVPETSDTGIQSKTIETPINNFPPKETNSSENGTATQPDDVLEEDPREELKQSTSIVRAVDTQDVATSGSGTNPYVLEGLPPELDYITDDDVEEIYDDKGNYIKKNILYVAAGICFLAGLFIGKTLFATQTIEKHGLEGVVTNPDVPSGRARCGLTDKSQACVFYVLNWYKQELNGRDFYKLAAQLTGREEYMIETDNLRYATVKIKPGQFAQLNIPALK